MNSVYLPAQRPKGYKNLRISVVTEKKKDETRTVLMVMVNHLNYPTPFLPLPLPYPYNVYIKHCTFSILVRSFQG